MYARWIYSILFVSEMRRKVGEMHLTVISCTERAVKLKKLLQEKYKTGKMQDWKKKV